ncbi:NPCBM/NEW2 domain protein [Gimesia panareensis]|uniref:NPCBM/NEW2 domain protein n=1 Tax=Gimesia panareensis TaxID=2527978 RepID=A0A518FLX2_9PLAN|nr:NPCBM/NEW2 domain-containing protein [Gimesia panareensis]QDV17320.1 NPCBM/NEW2 domain protein [Gimesia panareensis]
MFPLKSQFIVHILLVVWCALVLPGGTQVLRAFPPAENVDFSEKYRQLLQAASSAPSKISLKAVAFRTIEEGQNAIEAGDYAAAVKIATLAVKIGKSSGNNHAFTLANSLRQRCVMLAREYRDVEKYHEKLQENPNDANAAFLYGQFVALKLNNWKEGLFWLSRGDNAAWRTLAKQEIANSENIERLPAVADGWYQLAQTEKGLATQDLERHAYDLYSRAWTGTIGPDRTAIGKKLSEMPLRYLNHMQEQDVIHGGWPFGKNGDPGHGKGRFTVNQLKFPNGLGMVPPSRGSASVCYDLDGQYKTFMTGVALMDDTYPFGGTVTFTVLGDNRILWKAPVKDQQDVLFCKVSVRNVKRLEIRTETKAINRGAHAVWLDPHVLK